VIETRDLDDVAFVGLGIGEGMLKGRRQCRDSTRREWALDIELDMDTGNIRYEE
jgi:hypothetical protein